MKYPGMEWVWRESEADGVGKGLVLSIWPGTGQQETLLSLVVV